MKLKKEVFTIVALIFLSFVSLGQSTNKQAQATLKVTNENFTTVEALTNHGKFDNTRNKDVSDALQAIFDELSALENVSTTVSFMPGVHYLDSPIVVKIASIKFLGYAHGGKEIAFAETVDSKNNFYRPIIPKTSAPFDKYKY